MSEVVSVRIDGAATARRALERCITSGGVAVFPSDGLYGLACDPLDEAAIERIHRIKGRDDGKPSAVLYFSSMAMRELLDDFGPRTAEVVRALLPGPVTLIVPNPDLRYPLACRDEPEKLGVRLIGGPLQGAMCPVFQTSANLSGEPAPSVFDEIPSTTIVDAADLAIDGGALTGLPSTVVDVTEIEEGGGWCVLREGGMSPGDLAARMDSFEL
jgi:L-threonylcarbamoyladenylate synthase